jgi:hypothetical protein
MRPLSRQLIFSVKREISNRMNKGVETGKHTFYKRTTNTLLGLKKGAGGLKQRKI